MIEKLVPLGFILICIGAFGSVIEYILFGTYNLISVGWIGVILSSIPLFIVIYYWEIVN